MNGIQIQIIGPFGSGKFKSGYVYYGERPKKYEDKNFTAEQIKGLGLVGLNVRLTNNKVVNLAKYLGQDE